MEKRKTSLDLLKIVCIFMIIILHYFNYKIGKGFYSESVYLGAFKFILESFAICASNVFIIIYGYNNIKKSRDIKHIIKNALKIVSIVIIYSLLPAIIFSISHGSNEFSNIFITNIVEGLWFPKHFILLLFISPLLNFFVKKLDKKKYIITLLLLIGIICIICPYVYDILFIEGGYNIQMFILLYLIGGYIKLYVKKNSIKLSIALYILCALIIFTTYGFGFEWAFYYNSIFVLIESIALFNIFNNIKMKENKIITELSTYSLAIYIIHTSVVVKSLLFLKIFKTNIYCKDINFIWNFPLTLVGIFIICFTIEYLRRLIVKLIIKGTTKR